MILINHCQSNELDKCQSIALMPPDQELIHFQCLHYPQMKHPTMNSLMPNVSRLSSCYRSSPRVVGKHSHEMRLLHIHCFHLVRCIRKCTRLTTNLLRDMFVDLHKFYLITREYIIVWQTEQRNPNFSIIPHWNFRYIPICVYSSD